MLVNSQTMKPATREELEAELNTLKKEYPASFQGNTKIIEDIGYTKSESITELECEGISFVSNHFHRPFEMWADLPTPRPQIKAIHRLG